MKVFAGLFEVAPLSTEKTHQVGDTMMQMRYCWVIASLIALLSLSAQAQQPNVFLCTEDIPGTPSVPTVGGIDLESDGCSDVVGLSSGIANPDGRPICNEVEVLKRLDRGSPLWLAAAVDRTQIQRIDLLFFAPDDSGQAELVYELSLRRSSVASVTQDVEDGTVVERLLLTPQRIVATFEDNGAVANIDCGLQR